MEITSFGQWSNTLSDALKQAKSAGIPEETIAKSAKQLGDYLASNINPDIPENKLLKAMWESATENEQQALANMVVKMLENTKLN